MLYINIKDKLNAIGMNRNQFAKECKIGYPAACKLYDGTTSSIRFDTLESVCKTLNCSPNDLFTSDDPQIQNLIDNNKSGTA